MLRKEVYISFFVILLLGLMVFFVFSCSPGGKDNDAGDGNDGPLEPQYGGIFQWAFASNPSHFDLHTGTGGGYEIGDHGVERLFELDAKYVPQEVLAKSHTVSEDGLVHTIVLHEGVKFHNGKEMTGEDVAASIERMLVRVATVAELSLILDHIKAVDRYKVEFHLTRPTLDFRHMMASSAAAIFPKELCEKYPDEIIPAEEFTGTGPYKLVEFVADRYAHLIRFEDYVPRGEEMEGRAGRKNAYFDEIIVHIIPDPMVRMMGTETGQYHYGWGTDFWEYERLLDHPTLFGFVSYPWQFMRLALNCAKPPTNDVRIRQAIQAAIDVNQIMDAGFPPALYELSCSKMWREVEDWYSEAGCEYYNQGDPEKARKLLEEAGYDGEPIILLGFSEYVFLKDAALVAANQLERAGFNVEVRIVDVGTFIANYLDPTRWNVGATVSGVFGTPTTYAWTRDEHSGWWMGETSRKQELAELLRTETDPARRFAVWEELQRLSYEEAMEVWLGPYFSVSASSRTLTGGGHWPGERFWNVGFKKIN